MVPDLDLTLDVSLPDAKRSVTRDLRRNGDESSVELSSQAMWYTFAHRWGLPTLGVSGRYRLHGNEEPFRKLKKLASAYSAGIVVKTGQGESESGLLAKDRLGYWWSRRGDIASQFTARMRVGSE